MTSIKCKKEVKLIAFNHELNSPKTFSINQDATELIDYISQLKKDGATCLDKIKFENNCDEILLFSDAINTIGDEPIETGNIPVYSISSGTGSNYSFLKRVATVTNGEFIDLSFISVDKAVSLMLNNEEKFLSCNYRNTEIKEVFPNIPTQVNDYLEVTGILKSKKATLKVYYGYSGTITKSQSFEISKTSNVPVSRIWAEKKIESLEMNYAQNQDEIFQLGRKFNIITPNTAFIVLDRVEDYVQHKIIPPDELKEKYYKLQAIYEEKHEASPDVIQERNMARFEKLKSWYLNPVNNSPPKNIESNEDDVVLFYIQEEEEIIPNTRQQATTPPPPPPTEVSEMLMIVENDIEIEEFEMSDMDVVDIAPENSSIKVLAWLPDASYMEVLRNAANSDIDSLYFVLKEENRNRPSFYIQVADFLFEREMREMAIRVLSNTLELDLENPELLKVVAKRLVNEGEFLMAIEIYEEIKKLRPKEPQSYRDLALAYMENKQFQDALNAYLYILDKEWNRFEEIKDVVLNELNNLILLHKAELNIDSVNAKYINPMPLDIRITLDWSSNENDIDLWIIDPNGEKCLYNHPQTEIGGKISSDFTRGYGPEEFSLKKAKQGIYTVYVNYFSESRQTITGPVTVYATLYTNYGTEQQKTKHITVQLADNKETRQIGQLEFQK